MFLGMCRECSMFLHQAVVLVIPSKSNLTLYAGDQEQSIRYIMNVIAIMSLDYPMYNCQEMAYEKG